MRLYRATVTTVVYLFAKDELEATMDAPGYAIEEEGNVEVHVERVSSDHRIDPPEWAMAIPYGNASDEEEHTLARRVGDL